MATLLVVTGMVALRVVVLVGTLLVPAANRWHEGPDVVPLRGRGATSPESSWSRRSLRRRPEQRRPLLVAQLGLVAAAAIVVTVWVLPSVL